MCYGNHLKIQHNTVKWNSSNLHQSYTEIKKNMYNIFSNVNITQKKPKNSSSSGQTSINVPFLLLNILTCFHTKLNLVTLPHSFPCSNT